MLSFLQLILMILQMSFATGSDDDIMDDFFKTIVLNVDVSTV